MVGLNERAQDSKFSKISDTTILYKCCRNFSHCKDTPHRSNLTVGISIDTVQLQRLLQQITINSLIHKRCTSSEQVLLKET